MSDNYTIKEVNLRRTINLGNYSNISVEFKADVKEDADMNEVLSSLEKEVKRYVKHRRD